MARLEKAIKDIVQVFQDYANSDGKLNKEELQKLFENEIENPECKAKIRQKICGQSCNEDIHFKDFIERVGCMATCCYEMKKGMCQQDKA